MLSLIHSATSGLTIEGDQTREAKDHIKKLGLRWSPSRQAWYKLKSIGQSDKKLVESWMRYYKKELEQAGFQCEVKIEIQSQEEVEESLKNYYQNKIDKFEGLSEKNLSEAQGLYKESWKMIKATAGNPILIGHHSEKRHRKWLERSDNKMRKSSQLADKSSHYADKANLYQYKIDQINNRSENEALKLRYNDILIRLRKEAKKMLKLKNFIRTHKFAHEVWLMAITHDKKELRIVLNEKCSLSLSDNKKQLYPNSLYYHDVQFDDIINQIRNYLNEHMK